MADFRMLERIRIGRGMRTLRREITQLQRRPGIATEELAKVNHDHPFVTTDNGIFCFDYIVDENWAGTQGLERPTATGGSYKTFRNIQPALDDIDAIGTRSSTIFLCSGDYVEDLIWPATNAFVTWVSIVGLGGRSLEAGIVHTRINSTTGSLGIAIDVAGSSISLEGVQVQGDIVGRGGVRGVFNLCDFGFSNFDGGWSSLNIQRCWDVGFDFQTGRTLSTVICTGVLIRGCRSVFLDMRGKECRRWEVVGNTSFGLVQADEDTEDIVLEGNVDINAARIVLAAAAGKVHRNWKIALLFRGGTGNVSEITLDTTGGGRIENFEIASGFQFPQHGAPYTQSEYIELLGTEIYDLKLHCHFGRNSGGQSLEDVGRASVVGIASDSTFGPSSPADCEYDITRGSGGPNVFVPTASAVGPSQNVGQGITKQWSHSLGVR